MKCSLVKVVKLNYRRGARAFFGNFEHSEPFSVEKN